MNIKANDILKNKTYIAMLLFLISNVFGQSLHAQEKLERIIVQAANDQVTIYKINNTGTVTLSEAASQAINNKFIELGFVTLQSPSDVVISPDGTKIALIAYSFDGSNQVYLFIYSFENNTLITKQLPGYGLIEWSWADNFILLKPPYIDGFDLFTVLSDIYIYDIIQDVLNQVTYTPTKQFERNVLWIPNTTTIVFSSEYQPCTVICTNVVENLFSIQVGGENSQQITHLDILLPVENIPYSWCSTQNLEWNFENERIYFVASCDAGDRELLISTTLNGDSKLEFDLPAIFPRDDTKIYSHLQIEAFHQNDNDNSIIVIANVELDLLDSPVSIKSIYIYKISEMVATEIFTATIPVELDVTTSALNPTKNLLALGTLDSTSRARGTLQVIDLISGNQVASRETPNSVCYIGWLHQNLILYDQLVSGLCRGVADLIVAWDIDNNEVIETNLSGGVQVIQLPNN